MALVSIFLGYLYAWLDECVWNIACSLGRYNIVTHAGTSFLQMFYWTTIYNPRQMTSHFGFDQSMVNLTGLATSRALIAEARFVIEEDQILAEMDVSSGVVGLAGVTLTGSALF